MCYLLNTERSVKKMLQASKAKKDDTAADTATDVTDTAAAKQ